MFKLWPSVNLYGIPERAKPVFFFPNDDKETLLNTRKGRINQVLVTLKKEKEKKNEQLLIIEHFTCTTSFIFSLVVGILPLSQIIVAQYSSVQFSHSVVTNSLRAHESQQARPPCASPAPGVYPNSCPSSR